MSFEDRIHHNHSANLSRVRSSDYIQKSPLEAKDNLRASKFSHAAQLGQFTIRKSSTAKSQPLDQDTSELTTGNSVDLPTESFLPAMIRQCGRNKVGCLSLIMLLFFTFSNFALNGVDAQIRSIDSPDLYDSLSADVIYPPTRYTSNPSRMGLGTAAISTVTEALSPILPFTGGVDLRREEHWDTSSGWFHTAYYMVDQVRDAFGLEPLKTPFNIPRGGNQASGSGTKVQSLPPRRKNVARDAPLSAATPFVPISTIEEMTLGDLTVAFQYAVESTTSVFNERRFLESLHPRMKNIVGALKSVAQKSRGAGVEPALTQPLTGQESGAGNIDALNFCAAMRLFAEWRVVRQVPEGYKGYAVGMSLGQKDVVQNVAKIEKAAHDWIEYKRDLLELQSQWDQDDVPATKFRRTTDFTLRSPTLRDLLEYEVDMATHEKLPRLKDKTAAMGLLWVRRQLHYQTSLFANILEVPSKFSTTNSAVTAAYNEVYGKFHGWAVQKIFTYSFQAAPEVDVIYRYMNPHQLKLAQEKASQISQTTFNTVPEQKKERDDEGLNPLQKLGNHIGGVWDNVVEHVVRVFGDEDKNDVENNFLVVKDLDEIITKEMTEDAHKHIMIYLDVVQPVLLDLTGLFDEMNMDDPSKV